MIHYHKATAADLDILVATRLEVLRAANLLDADADMSGRYDESLAEAVTELKLWLLDNWDETLYGARPEWTEIRGDSVEWQTMRVVIDETNPPMKPAGYDLW